VESRYGSHFGSGVELRASLNISNAFHRLFLLNSPSPVADVAPNCVSTRIPDPLSKPDRRLRSEYPYFRIVRCERSAAILRQGRPS